MKSELNEIVDRKDTAENVILWVLERLLAVNHRLLTAKEPEVTVISVQYCIRVTCPLIKHTLLQ